MLKKINQNIMEGKMSEYTEVESPFLTQLKNLGWIEIEHPEGVVPTDRSIS